MPRLFAVVLYDRREDAVMVFDHNLDEASAKAAVADSRRAGPPAFYLAQPRLHGGDAPSCKSCWSNVRRAMSDGGKARGGA